LGNRVADLRIADLLDVGDEKPHLADAEFADFDGLRGEDPDLQRLVVLTLGHEADLHARSNRAVDHADDDDDPAIRVEPGVEDQRLERRVRIAARGGKAMDDGLENFRNTGPDFGARQNGAGSVETDDFLDLTPGF